VTGLVVVPLTGSFIGCEGRCSYVGNTECVPVWRPLGSSHCPDHPGRLGGAMLAHMEFRETWMSWTTPTLVEICIGLEINGYLPAEFW